LARELLGIYVNLREPNIVNQLRHIRVLIAFTCVSKIPEDTIKQWKDVLNWNRFYNPLEEQVFTYGVIYLFLCILWYRLRNIYTSIECFRSTIEVFRKKQHQFLIPGIGTYLFYKVCEKVQYTIG
jgi:hypothetical protein